MHRVSLLAFSLALAVAASPQAAYGQATYDQTVLAEILDRPGYVPAAPVRYAHYPVAHPSGNSVLARHSLYEAIGNGDKRLGRDRLVLAQLLGGPRAGDLRIGDVLTLPAQPADFDLGAVAFAPFGPFWLGAYAQDRVVVVDKTTQTWAAYGRGHLLRWGPASTGAAASPTPTGRFTINWRELERNSTEAPPGETWRMRYVMNIHERRGIHLHQYDIVPTGPPQGHGCIRMVEADARWLWQWTAPDPGRTIVIVQGTEPVGDPVRFVDGPDGPRRVYVTLPDDPLAVPRGDR